MQLRNRIETGGIELLGQERPDLLVVICSENFLPPTQLIYALQALEWYPDKEGIIPLLQDLLSHDSKAVVEQTARTLGIEIEDGPELA